MTSDSTNLFQQLLMLQPNNKPIFTGNRSPQQQAYDQARAQADMLNTVLQNMPQALRHPLNTLIYHAVQPVSYTYNGAVGPEADKARVLDGIKGYLLHGKDRGNDFSGIGVFPGDTNLIHSAWKRYLELDDDGGFLPSTYAPSKHTSNISYFTPNDSEYQAVTRDPSFVRDVVEATAAGGKRGYFNLTNVRPHGGDPNAIIAQFLNPKLALLFNQAKLSKATDEHGAYISIYDKFDLANNPLEGAIGKPFEIYDRIYYDPKTYNRVYFDPKTHEAIVPKAN